MTTEQLNELTQRIRGELRNDPTSREGGNFARCTARFAGKMDQDVNSFIASIETYKECAQVSDTIALKGPPLLLEDLAATWWQRVKATTETWFAAIEELRGAYGARKTNHHLYLELFLSKQEDGEMTDRFLCIKRALLA
ncbi:hypothetical protein RI129_009600 [Pyrocoelia pectoralis]|uniref:Activity-regulated cytoskeleton associated protein 2 n=1 Tax=Pyrocoelia pectoralis TaxID=417401 RepID=A0AAN7V6F0_9COLE